MRTFARAAVVVAVAAGSGQADILRSLGVDVVVEGGQTMNPSTADLLAAVAQANAESVIILPDNGNIVMAAQSAADAAEIPVSVVAAKSVPQGFSAMFAFDPAASLEDNVSAMTEALAGVHDGEVTCAVRDSSASDGTPIHAGDVIGLEDGAIVAVGSGVIDVACALVSRVQADAQGDTLTLLAGADLSDADLATIVERVEAAEPDLEVDAQRGEQPLYPLIFSIE